MLQLLVYGEILPNVCHMLQYNRRRIRRAVVLGSLIPLLLLTGWAALGVALVPSVTASSSSLPAVAVDPVNILLQGGDAVAQRLFVLSTSAIGTTILGSLLALDSAYRDVLRMIFGPSSASSVPQDDTAERRQSNDAALQFWQRPMVAALAITIPPTLIAAISPSIFLQAIDFAGSYPILLLYGILPPVMALKLGLAGKKRYQVLAILSGTMVLLSAVTDVKSFVGTIVSFISPR